METERSFLTRLLWMLGQEQHQAVTYQLDITIVLPPDCDAVEG